MENYNDEFVEIFEKVKKDFNRTNILLTGKTGVGKSTLLNAVFGEDLAKTGSGKPCTSNIKEYTKEDCPIHLIDTRGLELENFDLIANDLEEEINRRRKSTDSSNYIHIAWYCIDYTSKRIEDAEINFIKTISKYIQVIVVLTKCIDKNSTFYDQINSLCYEFADTIKVLALPYETPIGTVPAFGLKDLIEKTTQYIPKAQQGAFIAAQKVDLSLKEKLAGKYVAAAATAAAAAGATPIPFSDAAILAPIQVGMLGSISLSMGLDLNKSFLLTLVTSAAGVVGAMYVGKSIVSGLLKLIPGGGSLVGGVISATTAAALTTTMGLAYIEAIKYLITNNIEITPEILSATFVNVLKSKK